MEARQSFDDFRLGAALLGLGEDTLQAGLSLLEGREDLAAKQGDQGSGQRGGGLPAFAARPLFFHGKDHLVISKELKSLADRAFTHPKSTLDMVEIQRT